MKYHLRQALLALKANLTATLATLTTMILALFMLGAVALLTLNVDRALGQLESQVEVSAFLLDGADKETILSRVQSLPQVREAILKSKDDVLSEMTRDYPYVKEASDLAGNPFPDTLTLRVSRVADTVSVARAVEELPGVESVEYGAGYVDRASRTLELVRRGGFVLVGLLLFGTLLNILNAVRVTMYARRSEISVMRLLGARGSFIRAPYLIEGVLLGLVGGLVAAGVLYPGYTALSGRAAEFAPALPIVRDSLLVAQLGAGLTLLGIVVGFFGSLVASGRYLRELE